ncbi:hypothetical protein KIPB_001911 [Kipferlia bialata]|uniref:Uncharacterized protein n=1 Tax=Kipferlia bialata TaxID=797122 RepID=A0A9K3CSR5_9EUKA|nr:hypothetical protein KIPB_001911 [Kipferlia bialata]|eukprot:g1911.t1
MKYRPSTTTPDHSVEQLPGLDSHHSIYSGYSSWARRHFSYHVGASCTPAYCLRMLGYCAMVMLAPYVLRQMVFVDAGETAPITFTPTVSSLNSLGEDQYSILLEIDTHVADLYIIVGDTDTDEVYLTTRAQSNRLSGGPVASFDCSITTSEVSGWDLEGYTPYPCGESDLSACPVSGTRDVSGLGQHLTCTVPGSAEDPIFTASSRLILSIPPHIAATTDVYLKGGWILDLSVVATDTAFWTTGLESDVWEGVSEGESDLSMLQGVHIQVDSVYFLTVGNIALGSLEIAATSLTSTTVENCSISDRCHIASRDSLGVNMCHIDGVGSGTPFTVVVDEMLGNDDAITLPEWLMRQSGDSEGEGELLLQIPVWLAETGYDVYISSGSLIDNDSGDESGVDVFDMGKTARMWELEGLPTAVQDQWDSLCGDDQCESYVRVRYGDGSDGDSLICSPEGVGFISIESGEVLLSFTE